MYKRQLHNTVTDVYLVYLFSDNGSYRDYFVYNPDTGNIVPYIEKQSGTDTVTFIAVSYTHLLWIIGPGSGSSSA